MAGQPGKSQNIGANTFTAIDAARNAGFKGLPLVMIVAIARQESGLEASTQGHPPNGSIDRGILQINSFAHPEVTDSCAYDITCSFKVAFNISQHGTNFKPWCTAWSDSACGSKGGTYLGQGTPIFAYVSSISNMAGVQIPNNWKDLETAAQNNNIPVAGAVINAVSGLGLPDISGFMKKSGEAVGIFLIAAVMIVVGLYMLNQRTVNQAVKTVAKVAT